MEPLPEELGNTTEQEEETTALHRKRTRRVSFAEITSVHVFDRDEDFETPPEANQGIDFSEGGGPVDSSVGSVDPGDSDDSKDMSRLDGGEEEEDEDDEEEDEHGLFVRNLELYSPGSVAGSVTSNEEDNFFGPVSASFIRTGRLSSESAVSVDDQDVTLDSTAFSLHFRSLARSEDSFRNLRSHLKSPNTVRQSLYGKDLSGGSILEFPIRPMVLTGMRKSGLLDVSDMISTGGKSSNDMSLVNDPNRYDYENLSPRVTAMRKSGLLDVSDMISMGGNCSNDMSLVVDNPNRYDYGNLSPRVSELLALSRANLSPKFPLNQRSPTLSKYAISGKKTFSIDERARSVSPLRGDEREVAERGRSPNTRSSNDVSHGLDLHPPDQKGTFHASETDEQPSQFSSRDDDALRRFQMFSHDTLNDTGILPGNVANTPVVKLATAFQASSVPAKESRPFESDAGYLKQSLSASSLRAKRRKLFGEMTHSDKENSWTSKNSPFQKNVKGVNLKERNFVGTEQYSNIVDKNGKPASPDLTFGFVNANDSYEVFKSKTLQFTPEKNISAAEETLLTSTVHSSLSHPVSQFEGNKQKTSSPITLSSSPANILDVSDGLMVPAFRTANYLSSTNPLESHLYNIVGKKVGAVATFPSDAHAKSLGSLSSMIKGNSDCSPIFLKSLQDDLGSNGLSNSFSTDKYDTFRLTSWSKLEMDPTHFGEHATDNGGNSNVPLKHSSPVSYQQLSSPVIGKKTIDETQGSPRQHENLRAIENQPLLKDGMKSFSSAQFEQRNIKEAEVKDSLRSYDGGTLGRMPVFHRNFLEDKKRNSQNQTGSSVVTGGVLFSISNESNHLKASGNHHSNTRETILSRWKNASSLSFETKLGSLSTSISDLNLNQFNKLENMLLQLEKVKRKEKLLEEIKFKPTSNYNSKINFERANKARWLLQKLIIDKAKSYILKTKRDRLLKNAEQLTKENEVIQSMRNVLGEHRRCAARENRVADGSVIASSTLNAKAIQMEQLRITSMRERSLVLEQNMRNLLERFPISWGVRDSAFTTKTLSRIADHVQKQTHSRNIRRYLQLWELYDVKKKNGCLDIVLSYGGFLFQRFIVPSVSTSQIISSYTLNDADIGRRFPNTNALIAFKFIFDHKGEQMLSHRNNIKHDVQVNSFLLTSLLDLLEEIRTAQVDFPNLIVSTFRSNVDVLELRLDFIDFKTGKKVKLILDESDLKWASYPSEILPSQMDIQFSGLDSSTCSEIVDKFWALASGHLMVYRVCKLFSQLMETCSG